MSAELMKSQFVRPSVVRPCRVRDFLRIFFVFINMGPYGSKNFKTLLLLQIAAESFQTFPEFSS